MSDGPSASGRDNEHEAPRPSFVTNPSGQKVVGRCPAPHCGNPISRGDQHGSGRYVCPLCGHAAAVHELGTYP